MSVSRVREQYERLPYPACDAADERHRLVRTWLDDLPMINHYGFAGRCDFRRGFRVLVAGGGTGDATIFLAHQLRDTDAEIVHLDFSRTSTDIARERARLRGLTNITWIDDSLLRLPELAAGEFDYINCVGVLHHLDDPQRGLDALISVRKPHGVLGIMVYARDGRTGVYQMQRLLHLMGTTEQPHDDAIKAARDVLATLPATNWFRHNERTVGDHLRGGDAGLYDLLLHSQDRAYSVDEIYEWFEGRNRLHVELTDVRRGRSSYLPRYILAPQEPAFLAGIDALPARAQHAIGELLRGDVTMHTFFATGSGESVAPYGDRDYVPMFYHDPVTGPEFANLLRQQRGKPFVLTHRHTGTALRIDPGRHGVAIVKHIDGSRTFAEVFARARQEPELRLADPDDETLFADFRPLFDTLRALDLMLLRHRDALPL